MLIIENVYCYTGVETVQSHALFFFFFYFQPPEGNPTSQFVEVRRLCIGIKGDTTSAYKDSTSGKLLTTSLTLWLPHPSSVRLGDGDV